MALVVSQDPGHMATGMGGGGPGGSGPNKPPGGGGKKGPHGGVSEQEKLIDAIWKELKKKLLNNPRVQTDVMSKAWARAVLDGYAKYPEEFSSRRHLANGPNRTWMGHLSAANIQRSVQIANGLDINLGGGSCYLPTLLASTQANITNHGRHTQVPAPDTRCIRCQRGNNRFHSCLTLPGAFHGACLECAWSNHYEDCSFSTHVPSARPRAESQAEGSSRRSSQLPRSESMNSMPPSPSMSEAGPSTVGLVPAGDLRRVDWAYEFQHESAGSRRGQAVVNFNYPADAEFDEAREAMRSALRTIADQFMAAWNAGRGYKPDRYLPPRR